MSDRELNLRVTANAEQAKTELTEIQKTEQGLVTSTTESTAATTASTSAIQQQGAAAAQSSDQVGGASDALNDLGNTASVAGLAQQRLQQSTTAATGAVQTATGVVEKKAVAETAQAGATVAATAATERKAVAETAETAATRSSAAATEADAAAELGDAAATNVASAATASRINLHKLETLGAKAAGAAIADHELSVKTLATGLIRAAAPALGFVTVIALLPSLIKLVVEKTTEWSKSLGDMLQGLDQQDGVIRKAGESTEDYQKRVNEAADANAQFERGLNASRKGLVGVTADSEKLRAEEILLAEGLHQGSQSAADLAFAYKELGLKMVESLKFEDAQLGIRNFVDQYDRELKKGENSARHFTDANKEFVVRRMEAYEDEGRAIPAALQAIADKYDIVTTKQKETLQLAQDQLAAWESLTPRARALVEESERMLAHDIEWGKAFIAPKINVDELLESIKRLHVEGPTILAAAAEAMAGPLNVLATKAGFANAAISALFEPDETAPFATTLRPGAE
jgi:hypothetical protein